jgi:exodeoxyribonuclease X
MAGMAPPYPKPKQQPQMIRVVDLETTGSAPPAHGVCEIGWQDVALGPWPRRLALAAHRADFEQKFCTPALTRDAEWICTWKCALRLWPDSPSFSNQVLRYWRKPHGMEHERGLPAHRAFPDAYVTAFHLRDMLNEASLAQLLEWSRDPGLIPRVRYGPDRGKEWSELDHETLMAFMTDRDPDIRFTANHEMDRRSGGGRVGKASAQDLLL